MTKEAIFAYSSYIIHEWFGGGDSINTVLVTNNDESSVTIKYEDGLVNRVPVGYFRDELRAELKKYKPVFILTCRCKCGCEQTHNHSWANFCDDCIVGACLPQNQGI